MRRLSIDAGVQGQAARVRRWLAPFAALVLLLTVVPAAAAAAAGPAQLTIALTPVHATSGATITTAGFGQNNNQVAYRVGYSCSVAECTSATVTLPATQLDPTYGTLRLLEYSTWTPPAGGGASISGTAATGITVNLGNVPAGTSSTFVVVYAYAAEGSYTTAVPAAHFPPGFQIQQAATIDSPNAVAPITAQAAPVTWQISIPAPSISKSGPASVAPDTDVTYTVRMGSGCFVYGGTGRIIGNGSQLCAEEFTVTDQLPAQAVFVSASHGGTYVAGSHTVVWTTSGTQAAGGWGSASTGGWTARGQYTPHTVTVRYPASAFPEAAGGADFITQVSNTVAVDMTYLDDAETTKTAQSTFTHQVARVTPFGRAAQNKDTTYSNTGTNLRYVNVPPDVTGMVCPASGTDDWGRACTPDGPLTPFAAFNGNYWHVDTFNQANVPGRAVVVDNDLAASSVRVNRIVTTATTPAPTIEWTATDGTTTTSGTTVGTAVNAPAGFRFSSAVVTSGDIAGPNQLPTDTGRTLFRVQFNYELPPGTPEQLWTNNATATMTYPDYPEIAPIELSSTRTAQLRILPKVNIVPQFTATVVSAAVVGGGQAVPGSDVAFVLRGATTGIPADQPISPQYVFIAPTGWQILPNSASFPAGSVPPGGTFAYRDVTVGGETRQAVVASWPTGATFGSNVPWPQLTVHATPTYAVPAGTSSSAAFWIADSANQFAAGEANWAGGVTDTTDVDGDADVTERFATTTTTVTVTGVDRLDVVKEICVPTEDGCTWVANPDIVVGVDPDATDITYRITLTNGANSTLTNAVAYDVLPFDGDARGSTFGETLNEVTAQDNVTLQYSSSSNPCRDEVLDDESNPGCDPDWTAAESGAHSIRMVVAGDLAPGESASIVFTANVVPGADADAVACNSVAARTDQTLPGEPRAVCATTQEADLAISVPDRLPLQAGRPGVVPFTVTNLGGSQSAPATVRLEVPAGIRVTSLTPAGWNCSADAVEPDGSVIGAAVLTCVAVGENGAERGLELGVPEALDLPAVIPDDSLVADGVCFPASVSGLMSDPVLENNDDAACFAVAAADALIDIEKDDALDSVRIGDEITYTLTVSNLLVGESLGSIAVTDALPEHVVFVSASDGGTVSDQGAAGPGGEQPGGTVTWTIPSLDPAGVPSGDGDGTGASGATQTVTVTVRVLQSAETTDEVVNTAAVATADPFSPDVQLTDDASDIDELLRTAAIQLVKSADPVVVSAVGDSIAYEFLVTNSGDVTLTDVGVSEVAFSGGASPTVACPPEAASLAPDASVTCTATYDVTQADLDAGSVSNTATATGTAPVGVTAPVSLPSTAIVTVAATTGLTLVKTATPTAAAAAGDEIEYLFAVTNTGNVTVSGVTITETAFTGAGDLTAIVCGPDAAALAPDSTVECSATYTIEQRDVDAGTVSNTATASADAPGALTDPVSAASTAVVNIPAGAELTLEKTISSTAVDSAGDTVTYLFEVTNSGNVTVSGIAIDERDFTGAGDAVAIECPATTLAPDASMTCVGTYDLVQADVDAGLVENTAVAVGVAPNSASVVSEESSADLEIAADPELALVKSASPTTLLVDQLTTYSFVVTNSGNVTVSGVSIAESQFTGTGTLSAVSCGPEAASLAPDSQVVCSATYSVTQEDADAGELTNAATATGTSPVGEVTSNESSVELPFDQDPSVSLVKSADVDGYAALNDPIQYAFRITNTGNVTLSGATVVEDGFSGSAALGEIVCSTTTLLPGQFTDCFADYSVTQTDLDAGELVNTATAEATPPESAEPIASESSTVVLPFVGPMSLLLEKTGTGVDVDGDGLITAGDRIQWSFTVTNGGVTTLSALEVDDPTAGDVVCEADLLLPGASVGCVTAGYAITAADAAAGRVVNVATASAAGAGEAVVDSEEASATVTVTVKPLAWTGSSGVLWIVLAAAFALLLGAAALWFAKAQRRREGL